MLIASQTGRFIAIMSHPLSELQLAEAQKLQPQVVELKEDQKSLLLVPEDPSLPRDWFVQRAEEVVATVGGITEGDTLHCMGQQQLAMAISSLGRKAGATLVESVTPRHSVDGPIDPATGKIKKTTVFLFSGFRTVHSY